MSKYELSLSTEYCLHWTIQDAVRELFQNAIDQQVVNSSNKMIWEYDLLNQTLVISNVYSELSTRSLLLGHTTKSDQQGLIGHFGEGYKLAALVISRTPGCSLTVFNYKHREIWTFKLSNSRKYKSTILVCETSSVAFWRETPHANLSFQVSGFTPAMMLELSKLNLHVEAPSSFLTTKYGKVLLDQQYAGKVFVGGLFICDTHKMQTDLVRYHCGYDFFPVNIKLDRDRKLVRDFDLQWLASQMWMDAIKQESHVGIDDQDSYRSTFLHLVKNQAPDVKFLEHFVPSDIQARYSEQEKSSLGRITDDIYKDFVETHGPNAVPVTSDAELQSASDYKPVLVTAGHRDLLRLSTSYTPPPPILSSKERLIQWRSQYLHYLLENNSMLNDLDSIIKEMKN